MKLQKTTRHRLFAGQPLEVDLDTLGNVRQDGVYAIHTEKGTRQGQFRVLVIRRQKAVIRYEGDPVRLLAKDGGGGDEEGRPYTSFEGRAVREEPEAVDFHTQKRLTKEAAQRHRGERPALFEEREDKDRISRLKDIQRQARRRGKNLTPLRDVLDREIAKWQDELEEVA